MKCQVCGAEMSENNKFCLVCGAKLIKDTPQPAATPPWASASTPATPAADSTAPWASAPVAPWASAPAAPAAQPTAAPAQPAAPAAQPTPASAQPTAPAAQPTAAPAQPAAQAAQPTAALAQPAAPAAQPTAASAPAAPAAQPTPAPAQPAALAAQPTPAPAQPTAQAAQAAAFWGSAAPAQNADANQQGAAPEPHFFDNNDAPVVSVGHWIYTILMMILVPVALAFIASAIGRSTNDMTVYRVLFIIANLSIVVLAFIWAFNKRTNPSKRNFFRAYLIILAVCVIIAIIIGVTSHNEFEWQLRFLLNGIDF